MGLSDEMKYALKNVLVNLQIWVSNVPNQLLMAVVLDDRRAQAAQDVLDARGAHGEAAQDARDARDVRIAPQVVAVLMKM